MTAANILQSALGHMQDRAATYDKPDGERSMGATVNAFNAVTGVLMTEEQGWLFMSLLKAVRSQQGAYRADSYEDGAAYFALAGESAAKERATVDKMAASFGQQNMIDPADVEIGDSDGSSFAAQLEAFVLDADERLKQAYDKIVEDQADLYKPVLEAFLKTIPVDSREPAAAIDDESPRAQVVQQNGEMAAEVYAAVDAVNPWKGAPDWAKYKAQDECGRSCWFENKPHDRNHVWASDDGCFEWVSPNRYDKTPNWRTTLISR